MIKDRLLSLPDEIYKLKKYILKLENGLKNNIELLKTWELQELDDIANVVDENGKAVYSNDTKRKAELERRKQENEKYIETEKIVDCLKQEIEIKKIELDRLYNEQGNLRAICRLEGQTNV